MDAISFKFAHDEMNMTDWLIPSAVAIDAGPGLLGDGITEEGDRLAAGYPDLGRRRIGVTSLGHAQGVGKYGHDTNKQSGHRFPWRRQQTTHRGVESTLMAISGVHVQWVLRGYFFGVM